jgi:hypothetical protein
MTMGEHIKRGRACAELLSVEMKALIVSSRRCFLPERRSQWHSGTEDFLQFGQAERIDPQLENA